MKKKSVASDIGSYSAASILTQLITLIAGILTRRFLGPTQMGVWSLLQIIVNYSSYSSLGATESILREIPFYESKGDAKRVEEIKNLVFSFSLLTAAVIAIGVLLYAFLFARALSKEVFFGLIFVAVIVMLQRVNNLYISFLRGFKHFTLASKQMIYSSILNAFLVAWLSMQFKLYGFMWAMCFSFLFNIVYIYLKVPFTFRWQLDAKKIWGLIQYGFPLMIISFVEVLFLSIDKIMIGKMLGVTQVGLYTVALLTYSYLGKIPSSVGIVLVPNLHHKFGERERLEDLRGYISKSSAAFSEVMPLLIGFGWFLVPYFARLVLPDFLGSIPPMRSLILSAYFLALFHPYSYLITVMRKQILLLPMISFACVLAVITNYSVIRLGWGITGVGIATTFVFWVKFSIVYFTSSRYLFTWKERFSSYLVMLLKFFFMVVVLALLWFWMPNADQSLLQTFILCAVYTIVYLPFLFKLSKDLGYLDKIKKKFFNRLETEEVVN